MSRVYSKNCVWCGAQFNTKRRTTVACSVSCGRRYINDQKRRRCPSRDAVWLEHAQRWVDPTLGIVYSHKQFRVPVTTQDSDDYIAVTTTSPGGRRSSRKGHHLVWEAVHGPGSVPPGKVINHINHNRIDNRIENLELISPVENFEHAARAGRLKGCGKGSASPLAVLSDKDVLDIRERLTQRERGVDLAREYGVSQATISMIKSRKVWTHI